MKGQVRYHRRESPHGTCCSSLCFSPFRFRVLMTPVGEETVPYLSRGACDKDSHLRGGAYAAGTNCNTVLDPLPNYLGRCGLQDQIHRPWSTSRTCGRHLVSISARQDSPHVILTFIFPLEAKAKALVRIQLFSAPRLGDRDSNMNT